MHWPNVLNSFKCDALLSSFLGNIPLIRIALFPNVQCTQEFDLVIQQSKKKKVKILS